MKTRSHVQNLLPIVHQTWLQTILRPDLDPLNMYRMLFAFRIQPQLHAALSMVLCYGQDQHEP